MAETPLSQVAVGDEGLLLFGRLVTLNAGGLLLSLESLPANPELILPGRSSQVTLTMAHGEYQMDASVVAFEQPTNNLLLEFTEPMQPIQRRKFQRFPVALPISARPLYDDGRLDPWQDCTTRDVSVGGLRVVLAKCVSAPTRADVRLRLPGERNDLLVSCKVAHAKPLGAGRFDAGLQFTKLSAEASMKFVKYLEEIAKDLDFAIHG
jgi:hypothetical protein